MKKEAAVRQKYTTPNGVTYLKNTIQTSLIFGFAEVCYCTSSA